MRDDTARTKSAKAADADQDELVGQTLNGRFEVVAPIARGGMGKVFRAIQLPLGRQVALKVLDVRGVVTSRGDFQRRFFLEAATAAKLNHPNTIVVFDYGLAGDDVYFIAMELVEGRTLAQTFKEHGPMEPLRVVHIGKQICGSLGEAHAIGVVHRDLKPSNVLLARRGQDPDFVKVLDFGLVKVLGDEESGTELTQSGVMMGTPRYMSPEQVTGREVTGQSDIYALGAVLYHALAGRPPFDGESKFEIFTAHVSTPPVPLRDMYPLYSAPARLEALVMRCLAKEKSQRFRTMEEVERELVLCERDMRANPLAYATGSTATTMQRAMPRPAPAPAPTIATAPTRVAPPPVAPPPVAPPSAQVAAPSSVIVAPPSEPAQLGAVSQSGAQTHPHSQPNGAYSSGAQPPSGAHPPSGAPLYDPQQSSYISATGPAFQLPRETPTSSARGGLAGFLGVLLALALVALGAAGYYALTHSNDPPSAPRTPGEPPVDGVVATPIAVVDTEVAAPQIVPVRIVCNVLGARLQRGSVDLGDCGAPLPVPAGESWEIDITAPGHLARRVVVFAGQGDVPVTLTRRSGGGGTRISNPEAGGSTPTPRRGGDVRNPWD